MNLAPPTKPRAALKPVDIPIHALGIRLAPPTKPRAALKHAKYKFVLYEEPACTTNKAACGIETSIILAPKKSAMLLHHKQSRVRH